MATPKTPPPSNRKEWYSKHVSSPPHHVAQTLDRIDDVLLVSELAVAICELANKKDNNEIIEIVETALTKDFPPRLEWRERNAALDKLLARSCRPWRDLLEDKAVVLSNADKIRCETLWSRLIRGVRYYDYGQPADGPPLFEWPTAQERISKSKISKVAKQLDSLEAEHHTTRSFPSKAHALAVECNDKILHYLTVSQLQQAVVHAAKRSDISLASLEPIMKIYQYLFSFDDHYKLATMLTSEIAAMPVLEELDAVQDFAAVMGERYLFTKPTTPFQHLKRQIARMQLAKVWARHLESLQDSGYTTKYVLYINELKEAKPFMQWTLQTELVFLLSGDLMPNSIEIFNSHLRIGKTLLRFAEYFGPGVLVKLACGDIDLDVEHTALACINMTMYDKYQALAAVYGPFDSAVRAISRGESHVFLNVETIVSTLSSAEERRAVSLLSILRGRTAATLAQRHDDQDDADGEQQPVPEQEHGGLIEGDHKGKQEHNNDLEDLASDISEDLIVL